MPHRNNDSDRVTTAAELSRQEAALVPRVLRILLAILFHRTFAKLGTAEPFWLSNVASSSSPSATLDTLNFVSRLSRHPRGKLGQASSGSIRAKAILCLLAFIAADSRANSILVSLCPSLLSFRLLLGRRRLEYARLRAPIR